MRISLHDMRISSRISLHIILKTQNIDVRISYWKHRTLTDNSELKQSKYRISYVMHSIAIEHKRWPIYRDSRIDRSYNFSVSLTVLNGINRLTSLLNSRKHRQSGTNEKGVKLILGNATTWIASKILIVYLFQKKLSANGHILQSLNRQESDSTKSIRVSCTSQ